MQGGSLTDIAGSVPEEVDGHLVCILFSQHLLQHPTAALLNSQGSSHAESSLVMQHPKAASPPSQGHRYAESGVTMQNHSGLCQVRASNPTFLYFIWKAAPRPIGIPSPMKANPPSCTKERLSVAGHVR